MEKELNIAAILKDKPLHTKLWSPLYGDVFFKRIVTNDGIRVLCKGLDGSFGTDEKSFWKNGKFTLGGEVCLFPSKEMRYWEKFAWNKGDVLTYLYEEEPCYAVFEEFQNDEYTTFKSRYNYNAGDTCLQLNSLSLTNHFTKASDDEAKKFIEMIEKSYGGKLNLETLEIEQPKPEFKDGDIVHSEDFMSNYTYIYKEPQANIDICYCYKLSGGYLHIGNTENRYDCTLPSNTILEEKTRLATDSEKQQLFDALAKENKAWDEDKKMLVDLPKKCEFKPMDWCLMRFSHRVWNLCQFAFINKSLLDNPVAVGGNVYEECIPYNEDTKHLLGTTDEWEERK